MLLVLPIVVPLGDGHRAAPAAAAEPPAAGGRLRGRAADPRRRRRDFRRGRRLTGIQVLHVGSWPAPFGITLVADLFSALLVVMVGIIGVAVTGSSFAGVDPAP